MSYPTFAEARTALSNGETSCEALVSSYLDRIDARNPSVNAFLTVDREGALNHARYLDSQLERGNERPLAGLVLGVKDMIAIKNQALTCGSQMLEDFTSLYDAHVVEKLREAGAIFIGKTNCDEFGMGSSNETSHFGPVQHPDHEDYVPGGSSGGSAAAVADGMCDAALGTDTGGSVRQPAALCGVVGLKPTYGRVSRYGLVSYASSLDTIGPMGRSVEDVALLLNALAGADSRDSTSADVPTPDYTEVLGKSVEGVRIGLPEEYFAEGLDPHIRRMIEAQVEHLRDQGAEVEPVSLPHTEYGIATYYVLATAEASSNLARYDGVRYGHRADAESMRNAIKEEQQDLKEQLGTAHSNGDAKRVEQLKSRLDNQSDLLRALYVQSRSEGFGDEVKRRIMLGTYALSAGYYDKYYEKAQRVRTLIRNDFLQAFENVDLLLTPATPTPAFKQGAKTQDPLQMYLSDVYTVPASLAGIPGLSVPIGTHPDAPHLPVGAQLLAAPFDEAGLLHVGDALMKNVPA